MTTIYYGVAGWSYPDWKGVFYPRDAGRNFDELTYVSTFFDSIELNNTFYRIPESKMVESWVKRVQHNPRFRFTAKIWQGFTHEKKKLEESEIRSFVESMQILASDNRLGALLVQFPISFRKEKASTERLEELKDAFRDFPLVVEFRHRSWVTPDVLNWLSHENLGYCNVDEPVFRQMIKPSSVVTGPVAYVRFHGRNYKTWFMKGGNRDTRYDYLYSEDELDSWVPRIREMRKKAKDLYVVGNNHFRGQAPANILQLKSRVEGAPVSVPPALLTAFPQLKRIAKETEEKKT